MTDELLVGESTGFPCVDSSRELGDPSRYFMCKCVLLYWKGDYPGQGMISGFSHACMSAMQCHWCKQKSPWYLRGRALLHHCCQHLPEGHHMRDRPSHGLLGRTKTPFNEYPPPEARTHDESVVHMLESQAYLHQTHHAGKKYTTKDDNFPGKKTGVNGWCPFVLLRLFDIIKDICLDIMHIFKNWHAKHLIQVLRYNRPVAEPKWQTVVESDSKEVLAEKAALDKLISVRWKRALTVSTTIRMLLSQLFVGGVLYHSYTFIHQKQAQCALGQEELDEVDRKCKLLFGAVPGWLLPNARIMAHTKKLKCHPWLAMSRYAMPYLLHGIYLHSTPAGGVPDPQDVNRQAALDGMIKVVQDVTAWTSDVMHRDADDYTSDHEREQVRDKRELQIKEAMTAFEACFGHTEFTITLHQFLHMPAHIFEWNHVRNYWCFWSERYT